MIRKTSAQVCTVLAALFAAFLVGACAALPASDEAASAMLVGNWYGEMACGEACGDRDFLRWTRHNGADGEQRVHFRYYLKGTVQQNVLRSGRWGYHAGVYWLTCDAYVVDGKAQSCPDQRYEFLVESLTPQAMTYFNEKYGIRYAVRRVAEDFRLDDASAPPGAMSRP